MPLPRQELTASLATLLALTLQAGMLHAQETEAPATSVTPLCAKATVRAESNSRVSFP